MNDDPEKLDQYVEDLLQDRRPERTPLPDEDSLRARQTAAMLRAAKPGAGLPSKEFLERMQHSIPEWVSQQSPKPKPAARPSRRSVLFASAASLAAGVAATLGVERLTEHETPPYQQALVPNGTWTAVKAVADLPQGIPIAFRSGAIEGFLVRNGDKVDGLSAVCTHMGCILNYSKIRNQFECPCHGATFAVNGEPNGNYQQPLRRLPWLDVRIQRGQVEVYSV